MVGTSSSHPEWGAGFSRRAVGPRSVRRARRQHQAGSGRGPGAHPPKWARSDSAQWACAPKQAQSWCRPQEAPGRCRYRGPQHRTSDSDWGPPTLHSSTGRPAGPACTFRPESRISRTSCVCVSLLYTHCYSYRPLYNCWYTDSCSSFAHVCGRAGPPAFKPFRSRHCLLVLLHSLPRLFSQLRPWPFFASVVLFQALCSFFVLGFLLEAPRRESPQLVPRSFTRI